jgi:hypothetical protein
MTFDNVALSVEEMKQLYGTFYEASPKASIDLSQVPGSLHVLVPYAEFWGISDDWAREELVAKSSQSVQENLKAVVALFDDKLDEWLAGEEADSTSPSKEYVAFSAMRMAADFM